METQTIPFGLGPKAQEISRSVAGAIALAALGVVAGFVLVLVIDPLFAILETGWVLFGGLLRNYIVQP